MLSTRVNPITNAVRTIAHTVSYLWDRYIDISIVVMKQANTLYDSFSFNSIVVFATIIDPTNTVVKKPNEMPMDSLGRSIPTTPPTNDPVSIKMFIMIPNSC